MNEIILIKFNLPEYENRLIEQIKKHSNAKLTVYDNYEKKENLAVVWNRLIEESKADNICLLNTDTEINNLFDLIFEVLNYKQTGAVGPVTNHCGTVQRELGLNGNIEEINDLSGFCYAFRKDVWREVGGFPEDMPFYGQESIFNRKLEDRGYKLMVDRRVFVFHHKSKSYEKAKKDGIIKDNSEQTYGAFHYWNYIDRLKILREIVNKDFKIAVVGGGKGNPFPLHKGIEQAVTEMFGDRSLILSAADDNVENIKNFNPDLYLCLQTGWHENLAKGILQAKKQGAKTVLYYNDLRIPGHKDWYPPYTHSMEDYFDYAFIGTNYITEWKEIMKIPNVHYMPQASIQLPKPQEGTRYNHLHIGGFHEKFHKNRMEIFKELEDLNITHLNAKGDGNENRTDRIRIQEASYGDYRSSDFSWGISPDVPMYTSDRLYNIICSGGCAIHFKPKGLEQVFEHKKHLYWFRTPQEAREIVKNSTEEERETIKNNAFKHGQKHHTYKMRLLNMLSAIYKNDTFYWGNLNHFKKIGR